MHRFYFKIKKFDIFAMTWLIMQLIQWKNDKTRILFANAYISISKFSVLFDRFMKIIIMFYIFILNRTTLQRYCQKWIDKEFYQNDIIALCVKIRNDKKRISSDEIWKTHRECLDIKKTKKQQKIVRKELNTLDIASTTVNEIVQNDEKTFFRRRNEEKKTWLIRNKHNVLDKFIKNRKKKTIINVVTQVTASSSSQIVSSFQNFYVYASSQSQFSQFQFLKRLSLNFINDNVVKRIHRQTIHFKFDRNMM